MKLILLPGVLKKLGQFDQSVLELDRGSGLLGQFDQPSSAVLLPMDPGVPQGLLLMTVTLITEGPAVRPMNARTPAAAERAAAGRRFAHLNPLTQTVVGLALIGRPSR